MDALQSDVPTWSPYNYGFCNSIIFNDPSGDNPEENKNVNGYTVKTVILDTEGHPLPEGAKLPYSQDYTNTALNEHKKNLDKGEVTVGTQVLQEAQGKGGMRTITVTYHMGWGAKEGKPFLGGYEDKFAPYEEPKPVKPTDDGLPQPQTEKAPPLSIPVTSAVTPVPLVRPHPRPVTPPRPRVLPPPPAKIIVPDSAIPGLMTQTDRMTQELFDYSKDVTKLLRETSVGSVELVLNLTKQFMDNWGISDKNGVISVSSSGRPTHKNTRKTMVPNGRMHLENIRKQFNEFRATLQKNLNVPVI